MTFNIESAINNHLSILNTDTDFILLQEHWLWNHESHKLAELFPNYDMKVKCADDSDPLQNINRRRGQAGVATLWKKSLSHLVSAQPDG